MAALRKGLAVPGSNPGLGRTLYLALLQAKRGPEADGFAADWLKKHPEDVAFDYQVAVTAITRGNLEEAETRLRRVVAQRPNHPLALNNLAWTLAYRKKPGAVEFAQRAVDQVPTSASLLDTLAMALAADKQYAKALEVQRRAVDGAPADHNMRLSLAKIALQAGDKALARKELDALQRLGGAFSGQAEVAKLQMAL